MAKKLLSLIIIFIYWNLPVSGQEIQTSYRVMVEGVPNIAPLTINDEGHILFSGKVNLVKGHFFKHLLVLDSMGNVVNDFPELQIDGVVQKAAFVPSGIFLYGDFTKVNGQERHGYAVIDENGNLIEPFLTYPNLNIQSFLIQQDGKLILGGFFPDFEAQGYLRMVRFMPDGSIDEEFENNIVGNNFPQDILEDEEGNLIINTGELQKYGPNGEVYPGFTFEGLDSGSFLFTFAPTTGSKIYVGTSSTTYGGEETYGLFRLNPNGSLDTTFRITLEITPNTSFNALLPHSSGRLIVFGNDIYGHYNLVAFEENGLYYRFVTYYELFGGFSMAENPLGDIFMSGNFLLGMEPSRNFGKIRKDWLREDDRFKVPAFYSSWGNFATGAIDDNENLWVGGNLDTRYKSWSNILSIKRNGERDLTYRPQSSTTEIFKMQNDKQGNLYVANQRNVLGGVVYPHSKLDKDGRLIASYAPNNTDTKFDGFVNYLEVHDSIIFFGGSFSNFGTSPVNALAGLSPNGQLIWASALPQGSVVEKFCLDAAGAFYVYGTFNLGGQQHTFLKVNPDGNIAEEYRMQQTYPRDFGFDANGRLIMVGYSGFSSFSDTRAAVRFDTDGNLDATFPDYSLRIGDTFSAIKLLIDGSIMLGGRFGAINSNTDYRQLVQLNTEGEIIKRYDFSTKGEIQTFVYDGGNVYAMGFVQNETYASSIVKILMPVQGRFISNEISGDEFGRVDLRWNAEAKGADYIQILRRKTGEGAFSEYAVIENDRYSWTDHVQEDVVKFEYLIVYNNDMGQGIVSDTLEFTSPVLAPIIQEASEVSQFFFVAEWEHISDTDEYVLEVKEDTGGEFIPEWIFEGITSPGYKVEELASLTAYSYRVKRRVGDIYSAYSEVMEVYTLIEPPLTPINFQVAVDTFDQKIVISWENLSDLAASTRLWISINDSINFDQRLSLSPIAENFEMYLHGNEGNFYFKLFSINDSGVTDTLSARASYLYAPVLNDPDSISQYAFFLYWDDYLETEYFDLEVYEVIPSGEVKVFQLHDFVGHFVWLEGLKPITTYKSRLRRKRFGLISEWDDWREATTLIEIPQNPSDLMATLRFNGVALIWQDNSDREEGYVLTRNVLFQEPMTTWVLEANTSSYLDISAVAGQEYLYRLYAFNSSGASDEISTEVYYILNASTSSSSLVYPNPSTEFVTIRREAGLPTEKARLRDSLGRLQAEFDLPGEETKIDLSSFPVGLYLLEFGGQSFRLIKN